MDATIRLVIEIDIDEESLAEKPGVTHQQVLEGMTIEEPDWITDGALIATDIPGYDRLSHAFLCNPRIVDKKLV